MTPADPIPSDLIGEGMSRPGGPAEPGASRPRSWARIVWRVMQVACVAAALVHPVASLLSRRSWVADLISHFQGPALAVTLVAVGLTIRGGRKASVALVVLAAWQVVPLARYSGSNPVPADPARPERLRIVVANVLWDNEQYDDLARLIRAEKPDIVGIVEYTGRWREGLAEVREEFPFRAEASGGPMGLALWFRKAPLALGPAIQLTSGGWPVLPARFEFGGRECEFWLVHPSAPIIRARLRPGFPELTAIAERVLAHGGSQIVMGDLNTTDGSANFRDFLRDTGLRDSRLGFGRQGSWPSNRPYRLAIDHALVSEDLAVVDRRLGPNIGSDHLPLIVELAPATARNSASQGSQR